MRRLIVLLPLLLGQCLTASTPATLAPIIARPIAIVATPVDLFPGDPARRRIGALTFLGGWQLASDARGFGGFSALHVQGNRATALSDAGAIVRFRIGRFGRMSDARIDPVPAACAPGIRKTDRDTESLATDGARWWIGLEAANALCRTDLALMRPETLHRPSQMRRWPFSGGPEAMLRLEDGRFLIFAEATRDRRVVTPLLVFDRDPADPGANVKEYGYRAPAGFKPTDAAQLPDGRILVLNRSFAPASLFTAKLALLDPLGAPGSSAAARTIATFAPPAITDNYEGLAITVENGRTIVWLASDDNYMRWQRTLLLKFALILPSAAARPALSRSRRDRGRAAKPGSPSMPDRVP